MTLFEFIMSNPNSVQTVRRTTQELLDDIEREAQWNHNMDIDVGDYGYDGQELGNAEEKIESLQRQVDMLVKVLKMIHSEN